MSHHDEETERLLAELEGEQTEREQLEARAIELGVKFRGNTGDDTLRERIAEAEAEQAIEPEPEPEQVGAVSGERVITNPGSNVRRIGTLVLPPGGRKALTQRELSDPRTMAKIEHMLSLRVLGEE